MKRRTPEDINAEIAKLKALRLVVPARTFFGDNNRDAIDAQVEVLEHDLSEDTMCNRVGFEWTEHEYSSAIDARAWLDEDDAGAPSKDWAGLVK